MNPYKRLNALLFACLFLYSMLAAVPHVADFIQVFANYEKESIISSMYSFIILDIIFTLLCYLCYLYMYRKNVAITDIIILFVFFPFASINGIYNFHGYLYILLCVVIATLCFSISGKIYDNRYEESKNRKFNKMIELYSSIEENKIKIIAC